MEINVTVDGVDLSSEIDRHYVQTGEDDYASHPLTLADVVAAKILEDLKREDQYRTLRDRVREIRDEEIREQLRPIITETLTQPMQRTNEFGDPRGEPVSLKELIVKQARDWLNGSDGGASYGRDRQTRAQKLIAEQVDVALKKELNAAVADEKAKVVAAVRAKASDLIADAVKQGVGR